MHRFGKVIHLVLEFLHVAMSFVILRSVLFVALVHLFVVLFFSEADFLINFFDNLVHVLAFTDLTKDVALEFKHRFLDDPVVEVDHVGGDLRLELRVFVHDRL